MNDWYEKFLKFLKFSFENSEDQNGKQLTLRQWSETLRSPSGAISELLNGKRRVSVEKAIELLERANVPAYLVAEVKLAAGLVERPTNLLPPNKFINVIDDYDAAIMFLHEIPNRIFTDSEIAGRLGIDLALVEKKIRNLLDANILMKNNEGQIVKSNEHWDMTRVLTLEEKQRNIEAGFEFSRKALHHDFDNNLFLNMTFTGCLEDFKILKDELRKVIDLMSMRSANLQTKQSVFRFSAQAFEVDFQEKDK